eukprot:CCRYP_010963-RA/>CCRYP_010963-RA protein AED:0.38 eAED:0.38 QI:256/1/0.5/1/0/0/2/0/136
MRQHDADVATSLHIFVFVTKLAVHQVPWLRHVNLNRESSLCKTMLCRRGFLQRRYDTYCTYRRHITVGVLYCTLLYTIYYFQDFAKKLKAFRYINFDCLSIAWRGINLIANHQRVSSFVSTVTHNLLPSADTTKYR